MSRFFALLVLSGLACAQTPSSSLPASSPPASSLPETPAPSPSLPVISWPVTASLAPPSAGPAGPVIVSNSPNGTENAHECEWDEDMNPAEMAGIQTPHEHRRNRGNRHEGEVYRSKQPMMAAALF